MNSLRSFYCQGGELSSGRLLAAEVHEIECKPRCRNAILELDPENGPATRALVVLDQEGPAG